MEKIVKSKLVNDLNSGLENDEQSASKKVVHQFYFVKFRPYNDPYSDFVINTTQKHIQNWHHKYLVNTNKYHELKDQYNRWRRNENGSCLSTYSHFMYLKSMEMDHLHDALNTLKSVKKSCRRKVDNSRSHEKTNTNNLYFGMLHQTNSLAAEKRLLKEIYTSQEQKEMNTIFDLTCTKPYITQAIRYFVDNHKTGADKVSKEMKEIEKRREKTIADDIAQRRNWNPLNSESAIRDEIKLINMISEHLEKEKLVFDAEYHKDLKHFNEKTKLRGNQSDYSYKKWDEAIKGLSLLKEKRDDINSNYTKYSSVMQNATQLVQERDLKGLEELSHNQVEEFMSRWIVSKTFRDNYTQI